MAIRLTRSNNQSGITAYDDAVMFHLIKGKNGVVPGIPSAGDEFKCIYNSNTKKLEISSGMAVMFGRQWEITAGSKVFVDLSSLSGTNFITVYAELNTLDPTNEKVEIKSMSSTGNFPDPGEGSNLITTKTGKARMVLYFVTKERNICSIAKGFELLKETKVKEAASADKADKATSAVYAQYANENYFYNDVTGKNLCVRRKDVHKAELIETKSLLFSGNQHLHRKNSVGTVINLLDTVAEGDMLEVTIETNPVPRRRIVTRCLVERETGAESSDLMIELRTLNPFAGAFGLTSDKFVFGNKNITYQGGKELHFTTVIGLNIPIINISSESIQYSITNDGYFYVDKIYKVEGFDI